MSDFDRRKGERRTNNPREEEPPGFNGSEKRAGKDRRSWKDRRMDAYHQLDQSQRRAIYKVIEMMGRCEADKPQD
jgi:hypothetical protein